MSDVSIESKLPSKYLSITADKSIFFFTTDNSEFRTTIRLDNISSSFINGFYYIVALLPNIHWQSDNNVFYYNYITLNQPCNLLNYNVPIKEYNQSLSHVGSNYYQNRYSALITYNNECKLIWFGDLDFLNGLMTIKSWLSNNEINIHSIHDNRKLCHYYITYDYVSGIDALLEAVHNIVQEWIISDLAKIIVEYYPDVCGFEDIIPGCEYGHCETICDDFICDICISGMGGKVGVKSGFKANVRLEVAVA